MLQWGRPCGGAERSLMGFRGPPPRRLQWGRPCGGAERTSNVSCVNRRSHCFNGAAPVEGRKDWRIPMRTTSPRGFNGAAPVEGRKGCGRGWAARLDTVSFNGAAPVEGRKDPYMGSGSCGVAAVLQWGRPCGGAERRTSSLSLITPAGCFNGAAPVEGRKALPSLAAPI